MTTVGDARRFHAPGGPLQRMYVEHERLSLGLVGFVGVVVAWEAAVRVGLLAPIFISSPSGIVRAALIELEHGRIWGDLRVSGIEFALGFSAAAVLGILIGIVGGWYRRANYVVDPWLSALYATPDVALIPLIILVLGIGIPAMAFVVFLTSLFSVAINTLVGVQATEAKYLDVARTYGASHLTLFRTVVLPGALPFILTGLRLGTGRALVGVVVAELIASNQGIGHMISVAGSTLNTGRLMFGIVLLGAFGIILNEVMRRVEGRFDAWRPEFPTP